MTTILFAQRLLRRAAYFVVLKDKTRSTNIEVSWQQ
jgi:hypothetical protein